MKNAPRKRNTLKPEPAPAPDDPPHMIGYARVSMDDQDNRRQIDALLKAGVDERDIYQEKATGRHMDRKQWQACWKDLRAGDILVVQAIDRIGRDVAEVSQVLRDIHDKGANLKITSMSIDTRTSQGKLMFNVMLSFAQFERESIVERTMSGLAAARARGRVGGSKAKITDDQVREARARIRKGEDVTAVADSYNVSRQTIYRRIEKLPTRKVKP